MKDGQLLEKRILAKIDLLIEVILSMELCGGKEKEKYQEQGSALVKELSDCLTQLIGHREEYIKNAIKELLVQRMPEHNIGSSFGDFDGVFESLYQDGRKHHKPCKRQVTAPVDPLQKAVNYMFSQFNIIKNNRYQGCYFSYYIPSLKIAVDNCTGSQGTETVRKEYICRQAGIKLVFINCHELPCSREIIRGIKRRLDINNSIVLE